MRKTSFLALGSLLLAACGGNVNNANQELVLNDLEYFERQGVNVLVYSNTFSGGFNDEKNSGIEIIHHGVRTVQGGAVRLSNTPEQWDLVPQSPSRTVNKEEKSIEVALRYNDYDFDSRVVVTAQGKAVEIAVYLDEPIPAELEGDAETNLEAYSKTGSPEYERMVEEIRKKLNLTSLKFNSIETIVKSIGLPKCKICTHCFDGTSFE
jgi:hypothetical protein